MNTRQGGGGRGGGSGGRGGGPGGRGGGPGGRGGRGGPGGINRGPPRGPRSTRDRDGDLEMGARPLPATRSRTSGIHKGGPPPRGHANGGRGRGGPARPPLPGPRNIRANIKAQSPFGLVEVKVTGWGDTQADRDDVIAFLEDRADCKVKKSRLTGKVLILSIPYEEVTSILAQDNTEYRNSYLVITAPKYIPIDGGDDKAEKTIQAVTSRDSGVKTSETIEILGRVLTSRYNADAKLLDLSRLADDPILQQAGFFQLSSTKSKMFPAMMLVADKRFASAEDKRNAVQSVSLAYNGLSNINTVSALSLSFPDLKNLSLEGNSIATWADLGSWRFRFRDLEQLVLSGNPIANLPGYAEECVRKWPRLVMLDNVVIDRAKIGTAPPSSDEPPKAAGIVHNSQITGFPLGIKPGFTTDSADVASTFLGQFFSKYDNDKEALLNAYYDETSVFTISANTLAPRVQQVGVKIPPKPWEVYYTFSRNLSRVHNLEVMARKYNQGITQIRKTWRDLPRTHHDISKIENWVYDYWPVEGLPDPNDPSNIAGVGGMMVMIHGDFQETEATVNGQSTGVRRSFDRTFTLGPGKTASGVRVVNDMLVLRPYGGADAWKPTPDPVPPVVVAVPQQQAPPVVPVPGQPAPISEETKQAMLVQLWQNTQLTEQYVMMCLEEAGWDLAKAFASYEMAQAQGLLPPDAFRS
ncbi:NTF2-like protein [Ascobolus immersus RN42]|uniref:NTF2-like protein n=1 Tax=Ascobolus immersus RN42 TaxID=1160509 RepID=A0A3N4HBG9_ASCIM|nr:NTF2-like protein [Ascobolus immersus RN42]